MNIQPLILVTGSNGQLGRELRALAPLLSRYKFVFKDREELSIDQPGSMTRVFEDLSPTYCINAAAYTAVDRAEDPGERDNVYAVNAEAVQLLAAYCERCGTRLIHVSTDYVFDGEKKEPYTEDDAVNPMNVYGHSKLLGERYALAYHDGAVLRTSWVYSSYGRNFVKTMIGLMKERSELNVVNDQFGSPTYAADLARAIFKMIEAPVWHPGLYQFTNHGVTTWFEFAGLIRELIGSHCEIHPVPTSAYPTPAKRPRWSVLDNSHFTETFGYQARSWQEALHECLDRLREQGAW